MFRAAKTCIWANKTPPWTVKINTFCRCNNARLWQQQFPCSLPSWPWLALGSTYEKESSTFTSSSLLILSQLASELFSSCLVMHKKHKIHGEKKYAWRVKD
jgi:hypothetical protein